VQLPRLYAILDASCFADPSALLTAAEELAAAGCTLIQYRNKSSSARIMLEQAWELRRRFPLNPASSWRHPEGPRFHERDEGSRVQRLRSQSASDPSLRPKNGYARDDAGKNETSRIQTDGSPVRLIMNDRADLCLAAEFDGVHVGQDDLSPASVRQIIGWGKQEHVRWLGVSTHNPEQVREADQTSADYIAIGPIFATSSKANPDPVVGLEGVHRARELTRKPLVAIGGITRANARSVIDAGADCAAVISDLSRDPRKSAEEFLRILG
jgi:thiamine-phosphate pyrophosphorylase